MKKNLVTIIGTVIGTLVLITIIALGIHWFQNKSTPVSTVEETEEVDDGIEWLGLDPSNEDLKDILVEDITVGEALNTLIEDFQIIGENSSYCGDLADEDIVKNADDIGRIVKEDLVRTKRDDYLITALKYSDFYNIQDEYGNLKYEEIYTILEEGVDLITDYQEGGTLVLDMIDAVKLYGALPEEWQEAFDYLFR